MKKLFIFPLFVLHVLCTYSQAIEIPTKFSKMFLSAVSMARDTFEKKSDNLLSGQVFCALVEDSNLYVVSRTGDTWSQTHKTLYNPDDYDFLKTFQQCDTLEFITFFPTGKITKFMQKKCNELCDMTCYGILKPKELKEYISKNLCFTWW